MSQAEFEELLLDVDGPVATITLNNPAALNAVSDVMLSSLAEALAFIEDDTNGIRALVLTGAGKGFCSGANLNPGGGGAGDRGSNSGKPDMGAGLETKYHPIFNRIRDLKIPVVTAVNGAAAGVGVSFAMMGDMTIANKSSYFLLAFRRIGLVPDGGATYLLPRLIGMKRAMELALMGEKCPAETALEWGMINQVVEDGEALSAAQALAADLANGPTVTLGLIRKAIWESLDNEYREQLHTERMLQQAAGRTEDFAEGVSAFLGKRKAEFKGK